MFYIPLPILQHVMRLANHTTNDALLAIADMIFIALFFLLALASTLSRPVKTPLFASPILN
jgi:hypothetical protein